MKVFCKLPFPSGADALQGLIKFAHCFPNTSSLSWGFFLPLLGVANYTKGSYSAA